MKNFEVVAQGKEYTLIETDLIRAFVPKSWGLVQKDVSTVDRRWDGYTAYKNNFGYYGGSKPVPRETYHLKIGDRTISYLGTKYPVAISYEKVVNKPAEPVLALSVRNAYTINYCLPGFDVFVVVPELEEGTVQLAEREVLAFTPEAAAKVLSIYNRELERLAEDFKRWADTLPLKIGDTICGIKIVSLTRSDYDHGTYVLEGKKAVATELALSYPSEWPEGVEEIQHSGYYTLLFLVNGEWIEGLEMCQGF